MDIPAKAKDPYEGLGPPPPGLVYSAMPPDPKFLRDPEWFDSMGGNPLQRLDVFNPSKTAEEQIQLVKQILQESPYDPDGFDRSYDVLYLAANAGSEVLVKWLLMDRDADSGGPLDLAKDFAESDDPLFALQSACYGGHIGVVQFFVEHAASLYKQNPKVKNHALSSAAFGGQVDIVRYLLKQGVDPAGSWSQDEESNAGSENYTPSAFDYAARSGNIETMKLLLESLRAQQSTSDNSKLFNRMTFIAATQSGSREMLEIALHEGGYRSNTGQNFDDEKQLPLMEALQYAPRTLTGSVETAQLLIDTLLPKNNEGKNATSNNDLLGQYVESGVVNAASRGYPDMVRLFAKTLRECCASTKSGEERAYKKMLSTEALIRCSKQHTRECAKVLVNELGADINAHGEENKYMTILHHAARIDERKVTKTMLDLGADIHSACSIYGNGPTPLWLVAREEKHSMVRLLLDVGGPVESKSEDLVGAEQVRLEYDYGYRAPVRLVKHSDDNIPEDQEYLLLRFEEGGVTQQWLDNIELRRSDADLAKDGTGRVLLKPGDTFPISAVFTL